MAEEEEKIIDIQLPPRRKPGFRLVRSINVVHPKTRAKTVLPEGELLPLVRVMPPAKEKYRRIPFLVYHEACGVFGLGHGHDPVYLNEETGEFEFITEDTVDNS